MDYYFNEESIEEEITVRKDEIVQESHEESWKLDFKQKDFEKLQNEPFCCILENIYDKLSPKDLLNSSLVSKNWYNLIGKLQTFSRLKLSFSTNNYDPKSDESIRSIRDSSRIYENIEITLLNQVKDMRIAEQIIYKYATFIKCLKLTKFGGHNSMLNDPLNMPNLEEMEVQVSGGRLHWKFFENVTTLKKLTINGIEPKGLTNCLNKNTKLKELTLYENAFISYFSRDMSQDVKFQLKSLKVFDHHNQENLRLEGEFPAQIWSEKHRTNFQRLLSTQNDLKALHLDVCNADDLELIFAQSSLKLLEINKIVGTLPQNSRSINIKGFMTKIGEMDLANIEKILSLLPNLESLFIYQISIDDFLKILENQGTKLKSFHYFWASKGEFGSLVDLKNFHSGSVNAIRSTKEEFCKWFN